MLLVFSACSYRQLKGEGLEGLEMEQLQSLEDKVETSIENVRKRIEASKIHSQLGSPIVGR